MLAEHAVTTTGLNWESLGVILAGLGIAVSVLIAWITRRDKRTADQNTAIKQEIADSVNHLGEVLLAKLETKETVARISERLARLEGAAGQASGNVGA